jgi:hypothetical protein
MGVGYGLTRALMADVQGAQAGQVDQRELERQARQDLLKERLLNAQIDDFKAQARQRLQPARGEYSVHSDATGTYRLNSATGEWDRIGEGKPDKPERPVALPQGGKLVDPRTGKEIARGEPKIEKPERPIALAPGAVLVDPSTGQERARGAPKKLSVVERETNAAARTGLSLIKEMRALRQQSPTASQLPLGTAVARGPTHLPVVGEALKGVTEPIAQQFMTKQQAAWQQKADQLLHLASSVLPKGGRSIALLANFRASFTSAAMAKNPQAAVEALNELEKQLTEVLGDAPGPATDAASGGFQFKHTKPTGQ